MIDDPEDATIYKVVMNHDQQYAIAPAHRASPLGWSDIGKTGSKAACLTFINDVWTDMRPLGLRSRMDLAHR